MVGPMAPEYQKVSEFLGVKGGELAEDIARLGDIIEQSHQKNIITCGNQVPALIFSYFVGKGKLKDKYRKVLDQHIVNLTVLVDDFIRFNYNLALFK